MSGFAPTLAHETANDDKGNGNIVAAMKKSPIMLVIFLALLASGAGGYFFWQFSPQPGADQKPPGEKKLLSEQTRSWPLAFPLVDGYLLPAVGSYDLPPLQPAPDGLLLDPQGDIQHLHAVLDGRVSLVSFVYLLCGDTNGCPLATSILYELYHTSAKIPALSDHLQLITVSFDPGRDTPEVLQSFFYPLSSDPRRHDKIPWSIFTSPSEKEMRSLTNGFGQVVDRRPDSDVIQHLLRMYLIDRQGRVRNIYGLGMIDPALIMSDVVTLIMEDQEIAQEESAAKADTNKADTNKIETNKARAPSDRIQMSFPSAG